MSEPAVVLKKICLLGSFAVGKTSLVTRFVHRKFSDKYKTTLGVRVDKKELDVDSRHFQLMIWDIHGEDNFQRVATTYLRGAAGYLLVVDGTRPDTLDTARQLHDRAVAAVGPVPFLALLNKADLSEQWQLDAAVLDALQNEGWQFVRTSAKSGDQVDEAFELLAGHLGPAE